MSDPANIIEALIAVIGELPAIGKDGRAAPQQGGYAYRGIEQITQHTQPLFAKHGVVFTPHVLSYEVREIVVNGKPWTDVYEMVEYTVYGPGGVDDHITVGPILAIGRDNADKGANKCMTQAYKYALLQALSIADAKDDGDQASVGADHGAPVEPPPPGKPVAAAKRELLANLAAVDGLDVEPKTAAAEVWQRAELTLADHDGTPWVTPAEQAVLDAVLEEWLNGPTEGDAA